MPQEKAFPVHNAWKYVFKKERETPRESCTTRENTGGGILEKILHVSS